MSSFFHENVSWIHFAKIFTCLLTISLILGWNFWCCFTIGILPSWANWGGGPNLEGTDLGLGDMSSNFLNNSNNNWVSSKLFSSTHPATLASQHFSGCSLHATTHFQHVLLARELYEDCLTDILRTCLPESKFFFSILTQFGWKVGRERKARQATGHFTIFNQASRRSAYLKVGRCVWSWKTAPGLDRVCGRSFAWLKNSIKCFLQINYLHISYGWWRMFMNLE